VRPLQWVSVAIAILSTAGCGWFGTPRKIWTRDYESYALPVWTADGMYLVSGRSGALFLTPTPLDLDHYRGVVLDDIEISTADRARKLTNAEEERLKGYITRRLERVFERNGWRIVETPSEDVLRARVAVRGLDLERSRRSHAGIVVSGESREQITITLELRDGREQDRRLLYSDKRRLPFGTYAGTDAVAIRRVQDAFYYFSIDMGRRLQQAQRGDFPPPSRDRADERDPGSSRVTVPRLAADFSG